MTPKRLDDIRHRVNLNLTIIDFQEYAELRRDALDLLTEVDRLRAIQAKRSLVSKLLDSEDCGA